MLACPHSLSYMYNQCLLSCVLIMLCDAVEEEDETIQEEASKDAAEIQVVIHGVAFSWRSLRGLIAFFLSVLVILLAKKDGD